MPREQQDSKSHSNEDTDEACLLPGHSSDSCVFCSCPEIPDGCGQSLQSHARALTLHGPGSRFGLAWARGGSCASRGGRTQRLGLVASEGERAVEEGGVLSAKDSRNSAAVQRL